MFASNGCSLYIADAVFAAEAKVPNNCFLCIVAAILAAQAKVQEHAVGALRPETP